MQLQLILLRPTIGPTYLSNRGCTVIALTKIQKIVDRCVRLHRVGMQRLTRLFDHAPTVWWAEFNSNYGRDTGTENAPKPCLSFDFSGCKTLLPQKGDRVLTSRWRCINCLLTYLLKSFPQQNRKQCFGVWAVELTDARRSPRPHVFQTPPSSIANSLQPRTNRCSSTSKATYDVMQRESRK